MENTIENKEKFFVQYWGQKVYREDYCDFTFKVGDLPFTEEKLEIASLELKSLSDITNEDAIKVAEKIGYFFNKAVRAENYIYVTDKYNDYEDRLETLRIYNNGEVFYFDEKGKVKELSMEQAEEVISFIRSIGIAYQFSGLLVEQQIEYGWIKLTNDLTNLKDE